jgi:hypothetical protein
MWLGVMAAALLAGAPASAQEIGLDAENRAYLRATVDGVAIEKIVNERGEFSLEVSRGRDRVRVALGAVGFTVEVGGKTFALERSAATVQQQAQLRAALARSGALATFRKAAAAAEVRIDGGARPTALDETLLLDGAFVSFLLGDDAALVRHGRRVARQGYALMKVSQFAACYDYYYAAMASAYAKLIECNRNALSSTQPYVYRPALYWACQAEYFARTQSAYYQFLSCSAIPIGG